MAQVITIAGERLFALKAQNNEQLDIDTFIFANVPGQDPNATIDRNESVPPVGQQVHQQIVQQVGRVNDNVVIYSTVLDSLTGPFDFNWVGLYSSVNQTLIAVSHIPSVSKTITVPGAAGNTLNRNFGIEYSGIADLTGITVQPETWQLDFTARLSGMDELTRQLAADMNGKDWFIGDGFKVVPRSTTNTFKVTPGAGYVSGLRVELKQDHILTLQSYPQFVYVDAWFDGDASSKWAPKTAFTVTNGEMDDYIDVNGKPHYVFKLARITAADVVEDMRNTDGLRDYINKHKDHGHDFNLRRYQSSNLAKIDLNIKMGELILLEKYQPDSKGKTHYRVIENANDGTGFLLDNGLYANLLIEDNYTIYASSLGLVPSVDYSDYFNNELKNKINSENIQKFVLDTGDITVNNTLDFAYSKLTFSGDGELLTKSIDNMLQRTNASRTDNKKYIGKLNIGMMFNQCVKAAIKKGELRVVLFGDSIFVGNDYDSKGIADGYVNAVGVDNEDRHDCLAAQLYSELVNAVPSSVRVKFYSRSIGGLGYGNIVTAWDNIGNLSGLFEGREQATAGKAWRDCILDLNPDLVIHGMGMNESPQSYVSNFNNNWVNYLYEKQKVGTFDQAIITTPNPNFGDAAQFGDFRQYGLNASKFYVASLQRFMARQHEYSLIDVAFLSNLKRYGFDSRNCTLSKETRALTFPNGSTSQIVEIGSDNTTSGVTPTTQPIYHSTTFAITPSVDSDATGFDFKFAAGSIILQFNGGSVNLFSAIYSNSLGALLTSKAYKLIAGASYTFVVTILPSGIFVYHNDELFLHNSSPVYDSTLPIRFENPASSANVEMTGGYTRDAFFPRYSAEIQTNGEMYGNITYTQNIYGGGINHPSTVALSEVYLPPVTEFISDITRVSTEYNSVVSGTAANDALYLGRILNKAYNVVTVFIGGYDMTIKIRIAPDLSYVVEGNDKGLNVYLDPSDMSLFIKNTTMPIFYISYTGEWRNKKFRRMGDVVPRGDLLDKVPAVG